MNNKNKENQIARVTIILGLFATWITYFSGVSPWTALVTSLSIFIISFVLLYISKSQDTKLASVIPLLFVIINALPYYAGQADENRNRKAEQYSVVSVALQERDAVIKEMAGIIEFQNKIIDVKPTYDEEVN